jgi:hypothetical protein
VGLAPSPGRLARARDRSVPAPSAGRVRTSVHVRLGIDPCPRAGGNESGGRQPASEEGGASRVCVVWRGSTNELERAMHVRGGRGVRQSLPGAVGSACGGLSILVWW